MSVDGAAFAVWQAAGTPLAIEYSLELMEEIRNSAMTALQKLTRGGLETGGVLYGTRGQGVIRLLAMREMECEHARGPALLLSDRDRAALRSLMQGAGADPDLRGLMPVGWWVSHTRSGVELNAGDLEIFHEFFPAPGQITLVVHPSWQEPMRAGFFVRDALGAVDPAQSPNEFVPAAKRRAAEAAARPPVVIPRRERREEPPLQRAPEPHPVSAPVPVPAVEPRAVPAAETAMQHDVAPPRFLTHEDPPPARWRAWVWTSLLVLAIAGGALYLFWQYWQWRYPETLGLQVIEREGQLQVSWNTSAGLVRNATQGTLQMREGPDVSSVSLTPQQLSGGSFTYVRKTGDVETKLSVMDGEGNARQETARFLGQPPAEKAPADVRVSTDSEEEARLRAENQRLRRQIVQHEKRIEELETAMRALRNRLNQR
ncbi:MAG: hypothetical protein K2X35_18625 [Bryobacteraceae bacterium]|nr:hypothetical protein [Bryobacteraceae bacterium]